MSSTYAAAWRELPREKRRAKVEASYDMLKFVSLQGVLQGLQGACIEAVQAIALNKSPDVIYFAMLEARLAKSEILRRDRERPASHVHECPHCGTITPGALAESVSKPCIRCVCKAFAGQPKEWQSIADRKKAGTYQQPI